MEIVEGEVCTDHIHLLLSIQPKRNICYGVRIAICFTDPYCAWQTGTNENLNSLLREFYPKGRNLSRVSPLSV